MIYIAAMIPEDVKEQFRVWGREGGRKRMASMTKKQRRKLAKKAVTAREAKRNAP